ncbi:threonine/serine dehydratase [Kordiimonas sp. SCSIO 12610]|nr:threonine/serine dehydratase [Kordiimonas sp. SCSIO 12610]
MKAPDTNTLPINYDDVVGAAAQINGVAHRTPLLENKLLNERVGGRVFIKPECLQLTGSFKFRGAYNRISRLSAEERKRGVVAFSSGNHAQGVAKASALLGVKSTIVMPEDAPTIKINNTRMYGGDVRLYDRFKESREEIAREIAEATGAIVVPSFDDVHIMAGQGTAGLEIAEDLEKLGIVPDQVLINCGGGGLSSGSFTALKKHFPDMDGYVVEPSDFDDAKRSLETGELQVIDPEARSICDALLSQSPGHLTFAVLQALNIKGLTVSDAEVRETVSYSANTLKLIGEPGGVVSLAAILKGKVDVRDKVSVCVISGGNIDPAMLQECMQD